MPAGSTQGRVPELLARQQARESHMQDTPVYQILQQVAEHIVPLRLVDPKSPDFDPEHCRSLHDLGRLVHELSYTEMFQISDLVAAKGGGAVKLEAPIPLDLYLIDLGGGLTPEADPHSPGDAGPDGLGAPAGPAAGDAASGPEGPGTAPHPAFGPALGDAGTAHGAP